MLMPVDVVLTVLPALSVQLPERDCPLPSVVTTAGPDTDATPDSASSQSKDTVTS